MSKQPISAVRCQPCSINRYGIWARVWICRGAAVSISELSWPLARRILPRLLERLGVPSAEQAGLFTGRVFLTNREGKP